MDEMHIAGKLFLFLIIFTLISDFVVGLLGQGLGNISSLAILNVTSNNIQSYANGTSNLFSHPFATPFNATQTLNNPQTTSVVGSGGFVGFAFLVPTLIIGYIQMAIDVIVNIFVVIFNIIVIMGLGIGIILLMLFGVIPQILFILNFGFLGVILGVINALIIGYIGVLAFHLISNVIGRFSGLFKTGIT
jgi:hypothetical protein